MLTEVNDVLSAYEEFHSATVASSAAGIVDNVGTLKFLNDVLFYVDNPQEHVALSRAVALLQKHEAWLYSGIHGDML